MARTIASAFLQLRQNLEITDLGRSTVSTRQQRVRAAVEKELVVLDSFLTGSYIRSTMIAPLSLADIDIFVVLHHAYFDSTGQTSLLDKVRRVLLKSYPSTPKISRNGQAVTITFTDFAVDVVPAFNRKGGGYLIPDSIGNKWISTNPKIHVDVMRAANKFHNGNLVPVVKMVKGWNRNINHGFVSFYLELIAREIFSNVRVFDDPICVRYFFDKGRERITRTATDPAGYGNQVNGLDTVETVKDAVSRFETAYSRAILAEKYAGAGNISLAMGEWKKIFGDYFPAYG